MKIIIGSDHRGYELKEAIKKNFSDIEWVDVGASNREDHVDYPVYVKKLCSQISDVATRGVLVCGSGIGVTIHANRFPGIYAGLCWNESVAIAAREHDNINVLTLPADFLDEEKGFAIVRTWLDTPFLGGKYKKRLDMIDNRVSD